MTPLQRLRTDTVAAELAAASIRFGQCLRRWRIAQGWSQNTAQDWGRAVGIIHVFNSQWSQLENGVLRGARPSLFRALGGMNELLYAGQYGPITDRALLDRVKAAEAICHADGQPWDGADFYAAYSGLLEWPEIKARLPVITDDEAAEFSTTFRDDVRSRAKAAGLAMGAAMAKLLAQVPADDQARLGDVMLGDNWNGEELMALRNEEGELAPRGWLDASFA
jgi:transcriptional regulator with XRE-family HTH domain